MTSIEINNLLLHLLIVLFPVLCYQALYRDIWSRRQKEILTGLLTGLSTILCMSFPVMIDHFLWDLRYIPFIISVIYGGTRSGLITSVIMLSYRFYIGGDAIIYALGAYSVYAPAAFYVSTRFYRFSPKKRMSTGISLAFFSYFVIIIDSVLYFFLKGETYKFIEQIPFLVTIGVLQTVGMVISVFLVENMLEKRKMHREIIRAEQLHIVSELAASIAHEVRNPLTVVRGFIQLASSTMDERNQQYMHTVITELDRADFIISDYLSLAKPQHENEQVLSVSDTLHNIVSIMNAYGTMHGVELHIECEEKLSILADPTKFKQAIMNLIKNSIEASQHGTGCVRVRSYLYRNEVVIKIIDNGIGMTQEQLEHLGKPYYSTKTKGTGLGLMVTLRIIEAMNGRWEFLSEHEQGTEVTIRVPSMSSIEHQ